MSAQEPLTPKSHEYPNGIQSKKKHFLKVFIGMILLILAMSVGFLWNQVDKEQHVLVSEEEQQQQVQLQKTQETIQQLIQLNQRKSENWVLAEAEYLIRLANVNLIFEGDIPTTIKLLQTADQQVRSLANPSLITVRRTLANDMMALRAVPSVDKEGLLLRLNALSKQIEMIPVIPTQVPKQSKSSNDVPSHSSTSIWRRGLESSLRSLRGIIVIRYHKTPLEPLMNAQQHVYLIQNIQLKLAQAEWAVIHRENGLYQISLQQAKDWVEHYFVQDVHATKSLLTALTMLQRINVNPVLPDISNSLNVIRQAQLNESTPPSAAPLQPYHYPDKQPHMIHKDKDSSKKALPAEEVYAS